MTRRAMEPQAFSIDQPRVALPAKTPNLEFFPTAEGFYDYKKDQYIYQYKDQLGNARVSFGRNSTGVLEITDNNDYYPFGMNHLKTGNAFFGAGSYKNLKYQGQELQETGFYSFKWREYMPDVGRFVQIDPLAEKFPYNSTYAIQENKMGMGREFEGLELVPFEFLVMSNSSVRPTIAETMIREAPIPIEEVVLTGRAMPPSPPGFWEKIGNWFDSVFDSSSESTAPRAMDKTVENLKPESASENTQQGTKTGQGRGSNNRGADDEAIGDHTVVDKKGSTTYRENPNNPNKNSKGKGFETEKRVDYEGASHKNKEGESIPTPHVHEGTGKNSTIRPAIPGKDMPKI